jgi:hypothetical protein
MMALSENSPADLDKWLSIATRKLCTGSRERIRKEIEEHYLEAVDAARLEGCEDAEAQRSALESLGDPKSAARCFRRHHLTEFQAGLVKHLGKKPPRYRFYLYAPILLLAFVMNVEHIGGIGDLVVFAGMLTLMLASFASHFWLTPWLHRHRQIRASLAVDMFSTWSFFASMQFGTSLLWKADPAKDIVFFVIYGGALLTLLILVIPLLRKMGIRPEKTA